MGTGQEFADDVNRSSQLMTNPFHEDADVRSHLAVLGSAALADPRERVLIRLIPPT